MLGGGITNHNLKVTRPDGVFVLRVAGKDTELLGIDRSVELAATRAAAAAGVGPEVVDFVEPEGWLVTRFVDGRDPAARAAARAGGAPTRRGRAPRVPPRAADLRRVRRARGRRGTTATPRSSAARRCPTRSRDAHEVAQRIAERRADQPPRPCHNDLLNANFIDDGERLVIVDWEYAGMGDPFFDLANFSINHELDADGSARARSRRTPATRTPRVSRPST